MQQAFVQSRIKSQVIIHHTQYKSSKCLKKNKRMINMARMKINSSNLENTSPESKALSTEMKHDSDSARLKQMSKEAMEDVLMEVKELSNKKSKEIYNIDIGLLKERIFNSIKVMELGLYEKEIEVRLLLLAALSGEHILLIGPPGTAKSELGRRLSQLCGGDFFERLLTKFSVPEELFGPLSMKALEEDKYLRQIDGYLPSASVAFIDEIFKANSAILNTLLTILNERLFDNGSIRVDVPLVCLVGASNELPESDELDALYDRFLVRKQVIQLTASGLTDLLTSMDSLDSKVKELKDMKNILSTEDFKHTNVEAKKMIKIPKNIINILVDLRIWLQEKCEPPIYVSDRRLLKAIGLLQVSAYCNGRSEICIYDTILLKHLLWHQPNEYEKINDWLIDQLSSDTNVKQIQYLLSGIFGRACKYLNDESKINEILNELNELKQVLIDKLSNVMDSLDSNYPQLKNHLWLSYDESNSIINALMPKLKKSKENLQDTLFEVVALDVALKNKVQAVLLATLMPKRWADFIRNGPVDEISEIGLTKK